MGFFDKALKKVQDVGENIAASANNVKTVVETSVQDTMEITGLKRQIRELEKEMDAQYLQIGKKYAEFVADMDDAEPETAENEAAEAETTEATESSEVIDEVKKEAIDEVKAEDAAETVDEAKEEAAEWQGKYLRLHAEWDTYRRRMKEQREEESRRATEKLVEDIIPVLDDFERSINYANENGEEGLLGGVTAVYAKLNEVLVKEGVEIIDPVGQPYEALEAQAVATVDNPNVPDETVEQVYQKGYRMGNKVIRPAMVTVAVGGPKRETDEEEDNE